MDQDSVILTVSTFTVYFADFWSIVVNFVIGDFSLMINNIWHKKKTIEIQKGGGGSMLIVGLNFILPTMIVDFIVSVLLTDKYLSGMQNGNVIS